MNHAEIDRMFLMFDRAKGKDIVNVWFEKESMPFYLYTENEEQCIYDRKPHKKGEPENPLERVRRIRIRRASSKGEVQAIMLNDDDKRIKSKGYHSHVAAVLATAKIGYTFMSKTWG